jgi:hypothetical protein
MVSSWNGGTIFSFILISRQSYTNGHSNGHQNGSGWANHYSSAGSGGGFGGGTYGSNYDQMSNLGGSLKNINWDSQKLSEFEKNFYVEDKRVTARSNSEVDEFRRVKEIKVFIFHLIPLPHTNVSQFFAFTPILNRFRVEACHAQ